LHAFIARQGLHDGPRHGFLKGGERHTATPSCVSARKTIGFQGLVVNFLKRGNAVIPLEKRRSVAGAPDGPVVKASRLGRLPGGRGCPKMYFLKF